MPNKNAIILLSGGLDSVVSTSVSMQEYNIIKALHFDYGQIPEKKERLAFKNICDYYKIESEVICLPWLSNISKSSDLNKSNNSSSKNKKKFWIPNRNGLFANIGACYAEALNCETVIIGANKQEAKDFKDNSKDFILTATKMFLNSTQNNVKLYAPLIDLNKSEIIKIAIETKAPLHLIWSCYYNGTKHCGNCPSCKLLKTALEKNNKTELLKILF